MWIFTSYLILVHPYQRGGSCSMTEPTRSISPNWSSTTHVVRVVVRYRKACSGVYSYDQRGLTKR